MSDENQFLTEAKSGIGLDINFAAIGTNVAMAQALRDMVASESRNADEPRNLLDGMLPSTRDHLIALLDNLIANLVDV
jgi:hypothetical protein